MTEFLLILILVMLWVCSCTVCAIAGFFIAKRLPARAKPPPAPLSSEERRKVEKEQHEYRNFLNYAGDEMTPYEQQIR